MFRRAIKFALISCLLQSAIAPKSIASEFSINQGDYDQSYFDAYLNEPSGPTSNSKENKSILLFLNLNLNPKEALAVKRAANATGQNLITFPSDDLFKVIYPHYAEYIKLKAASTRQSAEYERISSAIDRTKNKAAQDRLKARLEKSDEEGKDLFKRERKELEIAKTAALEFFHFDRGEQSLENATDAAYNIALAKLLQSFSEQQVNLKTLVISGHHGWSYFGDATFRLPINEGIYDFYAVIKPLAQNIETIALWGCDTINRNIAEAWLLVAPNYKTIFGYSDSAPLGIGNESSAYLESSLKFTSRLLKPKSINQFKSMVLGLPGVSNTTAGVVARTETLGDLLFDTRIESGALVRDVDELKNALRCAVFSKQLAGYLAAVTPFMTGEQLIPDDDTLSPVKRAYFEMHHHQECFQPDYDAIYDTYQVGLLRFFETDVKFNIANALSSRFSEAESEIKNSAEASAKLKSINFDDLLTKSKRPEILRTLNELFAEPTDSLPKTALLFKMLNELVVHLDSRAMSFDSWHSHSNETLHYSFADRWPTLTNN